MKKLKWLGMLLVLATLVFIIPMDTLAVNSGYPDMTGTYTAVINAYIHTLNGVKMTQIKHLVINVTSQTDGVISAATVTLSDLSATVNLTGTVGSGKAPYLSLQGTDDSGDFSLVIIAKVYLNSKTGAVTRISGRVQGTINAATVTWLAATFHAVK